MLETQRWPEKGPGRHPGREDGAGARGAEIPRHRMLSALGQLAGLTDPGASAPELVKQTAAIKKPFGEPGDRRSRGSRLSGCAPRPAIRRLAASSRTLEFLLTVICTPTEPTCDHTRRKKEKHFQQVPEGTIRSGPRPANRGGRFATRRVGPHGQENIPLPGPVTLLRHRLHYRRRLLWPKTCSKSSNRSGTQAAIPTPYARGSRV